MLEELRLSAVGVIDEAVLELGPGFTAVTGETGAGKTMVVTALGLLLGARADSGLVRSGAARSRIEGRVRLGGSASLHEQLADLGADVDDGSLILARTVSAEGRSRAMVGGASVPVGRLGVVADALVAVHGQSDQHRLLQPARQRDALDRYGGEELLRVRERFRSSYRALRDAERQLAEVTATVRERAREAHALRIGLEELESAAPQPGEDAGLVAEEDRLAHADALRTASLEARLALVGDDETLGADAVAMLDRARRALEAVRDHDPDLAALHARVAEATYIVGDLGSDVASYAAAVESDPARLAWVQERRAVLTGLQRKYGDTVDEVLQWGERAAKRLLELDGTDERIAALRGEVDTLRAELAELGKRLSAARQDSAGRLEAAVTDELTALAMPHARVAVRVAQRSADDGLPVGDGRVAFGPDGVDDVEILLAANASADPRPLDKGASGGELSRVMLALEVVLAGRNPVPTLVFDEVDAGVGGKAAVELGRRLARLARDAQVLVVTHLPQVAAFADRHYVVDKSDDGSVTSSGLRAVDGTDRVRELSRMLAGLEGSRSAAAHAEELLSVAAQERAGS
ncbi:MAG: DNA repair protein RecN [Actinomycetota bacterium]|nr:DNA repair protein RecN [Actinomycetota bacterium]